MAKKGKIRKFLEYIDRIHTATILEQKGTVPGLGREVMTNDEFYHDVRGMGRRVRGNPPRLSNSDGGYAVRVYHYNDMNGKPSCFAYAPTGSAVDVGVIGLNGEPERGRRLRISGLDGQFIDLGDVLGVIEENGSPILCTRIVIDGDDDGFKGFMNYARSLGRTSEFKPAGLSSTYGDVFLPIDERKPRDQWPSDWRDSPKAKFD